LLDLARGRRRPGGHILKGHSTLGLDEHREHAAHHRRHDLGLGVAVQLFQGLHHWGQVGDAAGLPGPELAVEVQHVPAPGLLPEGFVGLPLLFRGAQVARMAGPNVVEGRGPAGVQLHTTGEGGGLLLSLGLGDSITLQ